MDAGAAMILPKGIVVNAKDVYQDVASHHIIPADQIWRYWQVYTTTNKKLKDPTACRLENFWWHVWGSDRRGLSGPTLARLYEDISLGPTFVPLKGPPNRWEGPEVSFLLNQLSLAEVVEPRVEVEVEVEQATNQPPQRPSSQDLLAAARAQGPLKSLSSSASKPPPAHPILKKSRGPSTSGPRPTARFISPHESADEDDKDSELVSSTSTTNAEVESRRQVASPGKKKQSAGQRKFVVASSAAKRRPLLPRRQSTQSSTTTSVPPLSPASVGFNGSGRETPASNGSRTSSTERALALSMEGLAKHKSSPARRNDVASVPEKREPSAKAMGKRPAIQRARTADKPRTPKSPKAATTPELSFRARSGFPSSFDGTREDAGPKLIQTRPSTTLASSTPPFGTSSADDDAETLSGTPRSTDAPPMMRSQSYNRYDRITESPSAKMAKHSLFTGATSCTTKIAAQGTIIEQSGFGSLPSFHQHATPQSMEHHDRRRLSSSPDSRMAPTQPSPSASVPLGRTKSQLTLLLERDQVRAADKPRAW